jgi:crotonobetainyl-CoA:carnitine CoA-transferase CaiB-like acyl-CoA transferase
LLDARHPDEIKASQLSHDRLRKADPGLAITAISWFGEHGPYRNYLATDSVCRSLAGLVKLVGPVEGPPVLPRDGQIGVVGGLTAFIPSLAGLYGYEHGARRFAVNNLEAMLHISEFDTGLALDPASPARAPASTGSDAAIRAATSSPNTAGSASLSSRPRNGPRSAKCWTCLNWAPIRNTRRPLAASIMRMN